MRLHGGGQEHGLRSDTENVAGLVGMGIEPDVATRAVRFSTGRETTRDAVEDVGDALQDSLDELPA